MTIYSRSKYKLNNQFDENNQIENVLLLKVNEIQKFDSFLMS